MYTFPFIPFRYSKTLTIGVLIMVLCLIPSSEFSKIKTPITYLDVITHFVMFFAFSAALYLDITKKRPGYKTFSVIAVVILISTGLAVLTELLQYLLIPLNRSGSITDLISDLSGIIAGVAFSAFIRRRSSVAP